MGIHFFHYIHGEERKTSHDVVRDVFVTIAKDARFHVSRKQSHVLTPLALQSSHHQVNIVLLVDNVHTLTNVVITNPT
jgi:hypothetical protein